MVYGVFGGCYSDWWVLGYFADEEKAKAFCERVNKNIRYDYQEVYIRELPNLENEGEREERINVCVDTKDWAVNIEYMNMDEIIDFGDGTAEIYMMIYPSQYDKAAKIAQDRWAQYKAQKAGIV